MLLVLTLSISFWLPHPCRQVCSLSFSLVLRKGNFMVMFCPLSCSFPHVGSMIIQDGGMEFQTLVHTLQDLVYRSLSTPMFHYLVVDND